jgi:hypothetical protein
MFRAAVVDASAGIVLPGALDAVAAWLAGARS